MTKKNMFNALFEIMRYCNEHTCEECILFNMCEECILLNMCEKVKFIELGSVLPLENPYSDDGEYDFFEGDADWVPYGMDAETRARDDDYAEF